MNRKQSLDDLRKKHVYNGQSLLTGEYVFREIGRLGVGKVIQVFYAVDTNQTVAVHGRSFPRVEEAHLQPVVILSLTVQEEQCISSI